MGLLNGWGKALKNVLAEDFDFLCKPKELTPEERADLNRILADFEEKEMRENLGINNKPISQNSVSSKPAPQQPACCPKCKAPLKTNAKFCMNCGTRI